MNSRKKSYTVYFGSELFSLKHLIGNAYLAEAIYEKSHGKYRCKLPQDFEPRGKNPRSVRDQDIKTLLKCDLGLFNYDGSELDSGTVIEYMIAKFADIPSVILRSDIRQAGDGNDPWNLMSSFFPRTINVVANSLGDYKVITKQRRRKLDDTIRLAGQQSSADAQLMCEHVASQCVRALDRALQLKPALPKRLRSDVYKWIALMPGLRGKTNILNKELKTILDGKVAKRLL
jgi:nucleoside 2-deoxyribosyltransferase|uniref:nucleoside 2-deoxyribosyltransferase n=1 Tax=Cephaloticoccus sp. TaxID=1985742 RepID=UPI004049D23E